MRQTLSKIIILYYHIGAEGIKPFSLVLIASFFSFALFHEYLKKHENSIIEKNYLFKCNMKG